MTHSKRKGAGGEREAAAKWSELFGVPMRRSQQYCGRSDESDDIVGALAYPETVTVRSIVGEPFDRIISYELSTLPEPVPTGRELDLEEVPF